MWEWQMNNYSMYTMLLVKGAGNDVVKIERAENKITPSKISTIVRSNYL
jgi:hypothetical protein